jgi:hypothetical protein
MGLDRCLRRVTGTELHPMCGKRSPWAAGRAGFHGHVGLPAGRPPGYGTPACGYRAVLRQILGPRTCGLRVRCSVQILASDLVSDDAGTCRELPFCPAASICGVLRIPDAVRAYRDIRANMEQTSVAKGLDH